jgi:hypothetical protein
VDKVDTDVAEAQKLSKLSEQQKSATTIKMMEYCDRFTGRRIGSIPIIEQQILIKSKA